jgi:hypothetical protein
LTDDHHPFGKPVKLLVDLQGYPDGRVIMFEIYKKGSEGESKLSEVLGVVRNNKGIGFWDNKEISQPVDSLLLTETEKPQTEQKYYFEAKIDEKTIKSEDFAFSFKLAIFVKNTKEKPIHGVNGKITFSRGVSQPIRFVNGLANINDAPGGKFKIELEDYKFVFEGKNTSTNKIIS